MLAMLWSNSQVATLVARAAAESDHSTLSQRFSEEGLRIPR